MIFSAGSLEFRVLPSCLGFQRETLVNILCLDYVTLIPRPFGGDARSLVLVIPDFGTFRVIMGCCTSMLSATDSPILLLQTLPLASTQHDGAWPLHLQTGLRHHIWDVLTDGVPVLLI